MCPFISTINYLHFLSYLRSKPISHVWNKHKELNPCGFIRLHVFTCLHNHKQLKQGDTGKLSWFSVKALVEFDHSTNIFLIFCPSSIQNVDLYLAVRYSSYSSPWDFIYCYKQWWRCVHQQQTPKKCFLGERLPIYFVRLINWTRMIKS